MNQYAFAVIHNIACIAGAVVLVINDYPWWAILLLCLVHYVKSETKS